MTVTTPRTALALAFSSALATLALAPGARADDLPPFGRTGHVVLDDLLGFRFGEPGYMGQLRQSGYNWFGAAPPPSIGQGGVFGYEHGNDVHPTQLSTSRLVNVHAAHDTFWIAPAVDVFVARRVSLGAAFGLLYDTITPTGPGVTPSLRSETLLLSVVPRVGYVVPITDRLALWPRLGVGYTASVAGEYFGPIGGWSALQHVRTWTGGVDLGVVFRLTPNLMLHLTPSLVASDTRAHLALGTFHDFAINASGEAAVAVSL